MAESLINMKLTPKEKKDEEIKFKPSDYPWGLTINLDSEAIEKLGGMEGITSGASVMITAQADVTSITKRDDENTDGIETSASLQITDMRITSANKSVKDQADKLFPKDK